MSPALRPFTLVAACAVFGCLALTAAAAAPAISTVAADPPQDVTRQSAAAPSSASPSAAAQDSAAPDAAAQTTATPPRPAPPPAVYSAASLYNSANSLARQGRPGLAVLDYERARVIDPGDADVEANLRMTRQSAGVPTTAPTLLDRIAALAGPRWFAALGLLGVVLVGVGVLSRFAYPNHRLVRSLIILVGVLSIALTGLQAAALWPTLHGAVVLTRDTPVRVSPVPLSDPLFTLPEAETVALRGVHDEFLLVETRAGRTGWVSRANVEPIVPIR